MNRYRVDFYLKDKIIGFAYVNAWSRKEAWVESWNTKEYKYLKNKYVTWDAILVDESKND